VELACLISVIGIEITSEWEVVVDGEVEEDGEEEEGEVEEGVPKNRR